MTDVNEFAYAVRKRKNSKNLGKSIEERPETVETREEFGHWEIDTVIGQKNEDASCAVVMTERQTRMSIWIKARKHTAEAIETVMSYFS